MNYPSEDIKYVYRLVSVFDTIRCYRFTVLKRTKCGVWIYYNEKRKFVNLNARKQFASRTKEEAVTQFIKRRETYRRILEANLYQNQLYLDHVKKPDWETTHIISVHFKL